MMFPKNAAIRLKGSKLARLREECYRRDVGLCVKCGRRVRDDLPDWHPLKYDMMHIHDGKDMLANVITVCKDKKCIQERSIAKVAEQL